MNTTKINGAEVDQTAALAALTSYAHANRADAFLAANCPCGYPYTQGDLDYLLAFAEGRDGCVVDQECVALMMRAGVEVSA